MGQGRITVFKEVVSWSGLGRRLGGKSWWVSLGNLAKAYNGQRDVIRKM